MILTQPPIRIIIADDHELYRDGFKLMIKKSKKVEIIAEAQNGKELIEMTDLLHPDVVVTDIMMPIINGIEATIEIKKNSPGTGVIALSMFDEDNLIVDMLEAGASGYLLKNSPKDEIVSAILAVHKKQNYYCSLTSSRLSQMIAESKFNPFITKTKAEFTKRELNIIKLICEQHSNKEIAEQLIMSRRTVEGYRLQILKKIDARNTIGIVIYAIKHRLFEYSDLPD